MTAVPALSAWPPVTGSAARHAPALLDWAWRQDAACSRLCLLTGGPKTGKSHLLAWLLAGSDGDPRTTIHATLPAAGQTALALAWELGRQLGYGPLSPAGVIDRLAADPRPVRILVPDLHRSGRGPTDLPAADPCTVFDELLAPLLALPHVRAAIEVGQLRLPGTDAALVLHLGPRVDTLDQGGGTTVLREPPADRRPISTADETAGPNAAPAVDWRAAPARDREQALDEALAAGTAPQLLRDPGFLVHGSATAITATLADPRITVPKKLRTVWDRAAPQLSSGELADTERAALLHLAALGTDARLCELLRPLAQANPWTAQWSRPGRRVGAMTLLPSTDTPGVPTVTSDPLGRMHLHDATTGAVVRRLSTDPRLRPVQLAPVAPDCVLALEADGTIHAVPIPPSTTAPVGADFPALHHNALRLAPEGGRATAVSGNGSAVVVGDAQGRIHYWSLADLYAGPRTSTPHQSPITALACLSLPETGVTLVISGGLDGVVRLWDSASGDTMPVPVERRNSVPTALALAHTEAGPVLAVAWADQRLHLWQIFEGRMAVMPMLHAADALDLTAGGLLLHGGRHGASAMSISLSRVWA
ncbi:hypothetical protein [Kitasatospora sp. NPDC093679]|uniref:hypothetical protein n=1 Tax=Kitasatospora sp. NPDC093679 TaxID=3154983 RepID=UPI00343B9863